MLLYCDKIFDYRRLVYYILSMCHVIVYSLSINRLYFVSSNFLTAQRRANRNIRANKRIEQKWLAEKFPEWLVKQMRITITIYI